MIFMEKKSDKITNNLLVNMVFSNPINTLLNVYICFFFIDNYNIYLSGAAIGPLCAFMIAYLNYEFSRKNILASSN